MDLLAPDLRNDNNDNNTSNDASQVTRRKGSEVGIVARKRTGTKRRAWHPWQNSGVGDRLKAVYSLIDYLEVLNTRP
jgi:hypothetical protein